MTIIRALSDTGQMVMLLWFGGLACMALVAGVSARKKFGVR
jgi:hypothetical protein